MRGLLDVNVLIALLDLEHPASDAVHRWLAQWNDGIATCPIVENGAVRIMSQPAYAQGGPAIPPGNIVQRIARMKQTALDIVFWPDAISLADSERFDPASIHGARQVTDIYLLGLAVANDASLVTLDRNIPLRTVRGAQAKHLTTL